MQVECFLDNINTLVLEPSCRCLFVIWLFILFTVNLSSDAEDKLKIYRENFEKAYLEATESFYKAKAPEYMAANGVQNYMRW